MGMTYVRLSFDPHTWPAWFPAEPRTSEGDEVDARTFTSCAPYMGGPLVLPTESSGPRPPITFGPFDMPVLERGVAERIAGVAGADVELVEASVEAETVYILNALRCIQCVDEARTVGDRWESEGGRPDRVGQYRTVVQLVIDPQQVEDAHVFRPTEWPVALIISSEVAAVLNETDLVACQLTPAS